MPTLQEITWPLEKRRRLEALWANDRSAAEIAEILGVTRNAVLGKIHRLKLAKRVNTVKRRSDRPVDTRIKKPIVKERKTVSPQEKDILNRGLLGNEAIFGGNGISLLAATSRHCAWPLEGKSSDGNPRCCGDATAGNHPYCTHHARIAYPHMVDQEAA